MKRPKEIRLCTFDTEGTSLVTPECSYACLYYWDYLHTDTLDVDTSNVSEICWHVNGRDCGSLYRETLSMCDDAVTGGFRYLVAVHNLSYDICYFRHLLKNLDNYEYKVSVSAKSSTRFLTVDISYHDTLVFTFFDTLALFGCSLRTLGDNLGFEKLHIDYYEMNSPDTELSEANIAYNNRDTEILMCAVCESLLKRPHVSIEDIGSSILTRTSIIRKGDREDERIGALPMAARKSRSKKGEGHVASKPTTVYQLDRLEVEKHQYTSLEDYMSWASYGDTLNTPVKGFFAGGVNISNVNRIGKITSGVVSYDLKSAYPAIMLSYRIPTMPIKSPVSMLREYSDRLLTRTPCDLMDVIACRKQFWFGTVRFKNLRIDPYWESHVGDVTVTQTMVLQYKKNMGTADMSYGYLRGGEDITLRLCSSEFAEMQLQYTWEDARFEDLTVYMSSERPTYYTVLRTIFHYQEKCVAKQVSKDFKAGKPVSVALLDSWLGNGYITFDEHEAIANWDIDGDWVESFVLAHKGNLNSLYGINVTSPLKDEYTLDEGGFLTASSEDAFERYLSSSRNSLMWREAGVCIAVFNRYKIAYMVRQAIEAGAYVMYVDTDSIKSIGLSKEALDKVYSDIHSRIEYETTEQVTDVVGAVNRRIRKYNFDTGMHVAEVEVPADQSFRDLGKLDYEGTYDRFVTMGHKKYAVLENGRWEFKCSGYNLGVLNSFGRQLTEDGIGDLVPLVVLGFDNRYDSSTEIATVQSTVKDTWVQCEFDSVDGHYAGNTCPGYAILPAGKVMNNTEHSEMNRRRMEKAVYNNPDLKECCRLDVRKDGDRFTVGRRGNVGMDWDAWDTDWNEGTYTA